MLGVKQRFIRLVNINLHITICSKFLVIHARKYIPQHTYMFLQVDHDALWSNESYGYRMDITFQTFMQSVTFLGLTISFLSIMIYIIRSTYNDLVNYRNNKLGKIEYHKQLRQKNKTSIHLDHTISVIRIFNRISAWFRENFSVDSGKWFVLMIIREFVEISLQSTALLLYNGTQVLSSPSDDHAEIRLAQNAEYVKIFTVFLCSNAIVSGILWIFYALKPSLCHGLLFQLLLYGSDALFDTFYALYPLIVVVAEDSTKYRFFGRLAALQTDSFAYWVTIVPMIFLLFKFWALSKKTINALRLDYANKYEQKLEKKRDDQNANDVHLQVIKPRLTLQNTNSWVTHQRNMNQQIINNLSTNYPQQQKTENIILVCRKLMVAIIGAIFVSYGAGLMFAVFRHFESAENYCHQLTMEQIKFLQFIDNDNSNTTDYIFSDDIQKLLDDDSELFLFEYCNHKVYPFNINGQNDACQCRNFRFSQLEFEWNSIELDEDFGVDMVQMGMNVFKKWYMLEKVEFDDIKAVYSPSNPPGFNFTSDMFNAKHLKAFRFGNTPINYFDDKMSNWQQLVFMELFRAGYVEFPSTFNQLKNIEAFGHTRNLGIETLPEALCSFKKLRWLDLAGGTIHTVPHCISELENLEFCDLIENPIKNIPLNLFNAKSLRSMKLYFSEFDEYDLMKYNNVSELNESTFVWKSDAWYSFQDSEICGSTNERILEFINDTECCQTFCGGNLFAFAQCGDAWQNGVCNVGCNTFDCHWDGGDCLQLCECIKDDDDYLLLGDGHCDLKCNTTNCNFDQYDCIDNENNDICNTTYHLGQHKCNPEWINDDWCDGNCQYNALCNYDGENYCDECIGKCWGAWDIISVPSNSITNDNHIDVEEFCMFYGFMLSYGVFEDGIYGNCTEAFLETDNNGDGQLSFHEMIIATHHLLEITKEKALQLNCSICTGIDNFY